MIDDRPRVSRDDVLNLLGLIAFVLIVIAITAVDPTGAAR